MAKQALPSMVNYWTGHEEEVGEEEWAQRERKQAMIEKVAKRKPDWRKNEGGDPAHYCLRPTYCWNAVLNRKGALHPRKHYFSLEARVLRQKNTPIPCSPDLSCSDLHRRIK